MDYLYEYRIELDNYLELVELLILPSLFLKIQAVLIWMEFEVLLPKEP